MIEEIFSEYNLLKNNFEVAPFGDGLIHKTWRIKNAHSDYILQKINETIFKEPKAIAGNTKKIGDYLANTHPHYLFVKSIKTKSNQEVAHINGSGYFRLCSYVSNSHTINIVEKPMQAFEAAKMFGEFTRILSGFDIKELQITIPDFHNLSLRYRQFIDALKNGNKKRIADATDSIDFIKNNKNIVDTYESILQNPAFKLRVTHHDTKISNVLLNKNDKGLCVIDLDTVMPGYFISDVGDMLRTYLSPVNEDEKDFSTIEIRDEYLVAIWEGYMSEMRNELSEEEKEHFIYAGKFMIYMQAIRFLTDYINNDTYYGARYEEHNYIRACNQLVLLQLLINKESYLKNMLR